MKNTFPALCLAGCAMLAASSATAQDSVGTYFEIDGISYVVYNFSNPGRVATVVPITGGYSGHVVVPQTVTYDGTTYDVARIDMQAFDGSTGLTAVTLPPTIEYVGENAFRDCTSLQAVYISDIAAWCSAEFLSNPLTYAHNLYLDGQLVTKLVIPSDVTEIAGMAFLQADCIQEVVFPASLTTIGASAFSMCDGLTKVVIPEPVTTIHNSAFYANTSLEQVWLPATLTTVGGMAFAGCSALSEMYISVPSPSSVSLGESVFLYTPISSGTLYVPVGSISSYLFADTWTNWQNIDEAPKCEAPAIALDGYRLNFTCPTADAVINASVTSPDFGTTTTTAPIERVLTGQYTVKAQSTAPQKLESDPAVANVAWSICNWPTTGIAPVQADEPKPLLFTDIDGRITLESTEAGRPVAVYDLNGMLLHSQQSADGRTPLAADLVPGRPVILNYDNHSYTILP